MAVQQTHIFNFVIFEATRKVKQHIPPPPPFSFVDVVGSRIRDKHPDSATLDEKR
jgi:hypothetical protein